MEGYLNESFSGVKSKNSSEEALRRWRKLCVLVKNPKRRFRFTANLSKRSEVEAMKKSNQEKLRIAVLVSKAALQFIQGSSDILTSSEYIVPDEVKAAGFDIDANELGSIVEGHDLKRLKMHGGLEGIASKLSTSTENGIFADDDRIKCRQDVYGINRFTESKPQSFWVFVWEALQDTTLVILTVCAFVSLLVGIAMEGWPKGAHDGLGIIASILLVVFVTATSDYRQSLQFKDLDKEKKKIFVQVTRNGYRKNISIYDLLPGDIVHLGIGNQVPADGLFVFGFSVLINESSLTGESEPVAVSSDNPFLLSGTKVQDGSCKMLVTTVGMRTQWGKLMATLSEGGDDETPLQVKLNGVATIIGKIGLFFAVVTFAVLAQRLVTSKYQEGQYFSWSGDDALEMLEYFAIAVTIVVVAVPEGLPLAVTLSLAFAMKKMMNDKALVRHLAACETMGSATSVCCDKTGTLTTNHMSVVKVCICENIHEVNNAEKAFNKRPLFPESAVKTILQSIFNNTSGEIVINQDGKLEILGSPTETALLEFGLSLGGNFQKVRQQTRLIKVEPFNSTKKRMCVVLQLPEKGFRAHCKGASEIILAACDKLIDNEGSVVPLSDAAANKMQETIENFASEALRTLCLAYVDIENNFIAAEQIPVSGYTCIGIVGIKDPVRPGVRESVAICKSAGITVRMVTGDNINTAKAIAKECGILTEGGVAIEGPEFREKSFKELMQLIPNLQVMARSSPMDKHTLVKHLRSTCNEVVAVTGDGTNDAPALHEADIGLAMGIAGTEVCSDINKPNGQFILSNDRMSIMTFISSLPIRKIGGIGKVTEHVLRNVLGINTCEDLLQKGVLLRALFSSCSCDFFLSVGLGLGPTDTPEQKMRKSMSSERTFQATKDESFLFQKLGDIAETLSHDMQKECLSGRTLTLKLKTASFEVRTRAASLQKFIHSKEDILSCAGRMLKAELPLSLRLIGLRMSQFHDDQNSPGDPLQKTIVGFLSGEGAYTSAASVKKQDCSDISYKLDKQEGLDLSDWPSMHDVELDLPATDDHTIERQDGLSFLCESHHSACSSDAESFKMNDLYMEEYKSVDPNELTNSVETVSTLWVDDYICSVCGIELPSSFVEERQEHSDYHLAERLQEEESSPSRGPLPLEERFVRKAIQAREGTRKKQKSSEKEAKHIPIEAFFSKCKKDS